MLSHSLVVKHCSLAFYSTILKLTYTSLCSLLNLIARLPFPDYLTYHALQTYVNRYPVLQQNLEVKEVVLGRIANLFVS